MFLNSLGLSQNLRVSSVMKHPVEEGGGLHSTPLDFGLDCGLEYTRLACGLECTGLAWPRLDWTVRIAAGLDGKAHSVD